MLAVLVWWMRVADWWISWDCWFGVGVLATTNTDLVGLETTQNDYKRRTDRHPPYHETYRPQQYGGFARLFD